MSKRGLKAIFGVGVIMAASVMMAAFYVTIDLPWLAPIFAVPFVLGAIVARIICRSESDPSLAKSANAAPVPTQESTTEGRK